MSIVVRSTGVYEYGHRYDRIEVLDDPPKGMTLEQWFDDVAYDACTGDDVTTPQGSCYEVEILKGPAAWIGKSREWVD